MVTEVDANKFVRVGKRNSPTECPVALAALEAIKAKKDDIEAVSVLGDVITLYWKDGTTTESNVDAGVVRAIQKFDETGEAEFPRMFFGSSRDAALDEFFSGKKREWGGYRRKESA